MAHTDLQHCFSSRAEGSREVLLSVRPVSQISLFTFLCVGFRQQIVLSIIDVDGYETFSVCETFMF
jgi:hypothetical protein